MYQSAMQRLHNSLLRNVYLFCVSCSSRFSLGRVALQLRYKVQFSIIYLLLYLWSNPLPQKRLVKVVPTHSARFLVCRSNIARFLECQTDNCLNLSLHS